MISIWAIILFTLSLNIWVWCFPTSFIKLMMLGKNAKVETPLPWLKDVWKVIENPHYIWAPRVIFGVGLIISIVAYIVI